MSLDEKLAKYRAAVKVNAPHIEIYQNAYFLAEHCSEIPMFSLVCIGKDTPPHGEMLKAWFEQVGGLYKVLEERFKPDTIKRSAQNWHMSRLVTAPVAWRTWHSLRDQFSAVIGEGLLEVRIVPAYPQ